MKQHTMRSILIVSILLVLLLIGLNFAKLNTLFVPSRSILIGCIDSQNSEGIIVKEKITDHSNQLLVDEIELLLLRAEPVSNMTVPTTPPDLYFMIESPKRSIIISEFNLWWQGDSALIQIRKGEDWTNSVIKKSDATALLELLN